MRFIAKKGEVLYMEDLAELITQHYQDLLENAPDVEGVFDDDERVGSVGRRRSRKLGLAAGKGLSPIAQSQTI